MVRDYTFSPAAGYAIIAVMLIFLLALPSLTLAQMGHDWGGYEGKIDAWSEDCKILVETVEIPSHSPSSCRYEWVTRVNDTLKAGILGYIGCGDLNVFKFDPPIEADSFRIRKRVLWHTPSGTKWRTTAEVTVFPECIDTLTIDPGPPVFTHSDKIMGSILKVESKIPFVLIIYSSFGFHTVTYEPGVYEIDLSGYVGMYVSILYQDGTEKKYLIQ